MRRYTHQALFFVGEERERTFFLRGSICARESFYLPVQMESHPIGRDTLSVCQL